MKEVKISFNKKTWGSSGTFYDGCFTVTKELFTEFKQYVERYLQKYEGQSRFSTHEMNEKMYLPGLAVEKDRFSKKSCVYMKLTQRDFFVRFLKEKGIQVNIDRAYGSFNYYLEVR